jgi:hypothetical protein
MKSSGLAARFLGFDKGKYRGGCGIFIGHVSETKSSKNLGTCFGIRDVLDVDSRLDVEEDKVA